MGRKLVRENELLRSGGLLSFPRTGCALCASGILPRAGNLRAELRRLGLFELHTLRLSDKEVLHAEAASIAACP